MINSDSFFLIRSKKTGEYYIYRVGEIPLWTAYPILARRFNSVPEAAIQAVAMGLPVGSMEVVSFELAETLSGSADERTICPETN